jgi:hypothetical protein
MSPFLQLSTEEEGDWHGDEDKGEFCLFESMISDTLLLRNRKRR